MIMCWHLCLTGVTMAGRASSVMNVCFILDASTGPATSLGSATVRGTGVACCVIKVWKGFWFLFVYLFIYFFSISSPPTQGTGTVLTFILHVSSSYSLPVFDESQVSKLLRAESQERELLKRDHIAMQNAALS